MVGNPVKIRKFGHDVTTPGHPDFITLFIIIYLYARIINISVLTSFHANKYNIVFILVSCLR